MRRTLSCTRPLMAAARSHSRPIFMARLIARDCLVCTLTYHQILYQLQEGIALVTLNRPEKRNALNGEIIAELKQAMAETGNDPQCRVVMLSGAGKDFCSGADLEGL